MSGIRLGDIPDMPAIVELGRELLAQSVYDGIKEDESKFRLFVAGLMGHRHGEVFLVVDDDDKPQGFLLGVVEELFFSKQRYATDIAVYVRDGFRHLAPRLLASFLDWAKAKPKVEHIMLGTSSGIGEPERIGKMYGKFGFSQVGGIYILRV